jgi:putative nucleotidyltransferase with HDIG domain
MDELVRQKYLLVIDSLRQLPTLPAIAARVLKVVNHQKSGAEHVAGLLENDPALASRVLKLANSSYYGIPRTISNIRSAIVILGFNTIKSLVLSSSVMKMFPPEDHPPLFNRQHFWHHCVKTAAMARFLAGKTRVGVDLEQAFTGGLLHDLGKLVLELTAFEEYRPVLAEAALGKTPSWEIELRQMGVSHAEISGMLLDRWEIPESLQAPVAHHHRPHRAAEEHRNLAYLLHYADYLAKLDDLLKSSDPDGPRPQVAEEARTVLKLTLSDEALLESATPDLDGMADFFQLIDEE